MSTATANNLSKSKIKLTADGVQNLAIFAIFVVICIVGFALEPKLFLSRTNIVNILVSNSSVMIAAPAMCFVLLSGNLDMSPNGVGAMAGVLFAIFARAGMPVGASALTSIAIGAACGFLCGFIISKMGLPSFIISLAFNYITLGVALIGAGGAIISAGLPGNIDFLSQTISGVPLPVVYAIIIVIAFLIIQSKTVFAREVTAIGANSSAARLSGISIVRNVSAVFALNALFASFAGVLVTSRFSVADSGMLPGFETDCIIACVLGGTDINGGRGTVFGTLIGALIVGVLTNIMNMLGLVSYTQNIIKGLVLIGAILLNDAIRTKVKV